MVGARRREGKKYAMEDDALDQIAKEVSFTLKSSVVFLLSIHHNKLSLKGVFL